MNENNDITQRAFWNLPAPGSIIQTHYGTPSEHACDAADYYINSIYGRNGLAFSFDTGKIEKGETENPFENRKEFINKLFNGYQVEIPKGNYQLSYGGMLAGKTHKRKQDEFIQAMLYGGELTEEQKEEFKKWKISDIYPDWPLMNSEKTPFEKAIESVAEKANEAGQKVRKIFTDYGKGKSESIVILPFNHETKEASGQVDLGDVIDYLKKMPLRYIPMCEGIPGKGCLKGQDAAGEICKLCNGTGFKIENDENKTS